MWVACHIQTCRATTQQSQPTFLVCLVNIDCRIKSHTKRHCWNFMHCVMIWDVCVVCEHPPPPPPPHTHTHLVPIIFHIDIHLAICIITHLSNTWRLRLEALTSTTDATLHPISRVRCLIRCISPKKSTSAAGEWPGSCREKDSPLWPDSSIADPSRGG